MKFKYLGTAAAEGIPALFCMCDTCREAKEKGGRNIRTRSQALINDELLIDFGPDSYAHFLTYKYPLEDITNVLITHNHEDHFYLNELEYRRPGYASKTKDGPLHVYGTLPIVQRINELNKTFEQYCKGVLEPHEVIPFVPFKVLNYDITPLKATHDEKACPVIYHIKSKDASILYSHDTGWYCDDTWNYLATLDRPLDFISIDCTGALLIGWKYGGHLSLDGVVDVKAKLEEIKAIDKHTKFVINHFSHNGHANYDLLVKEASKYGIEVSYDGMEFEISK